MQKKETYVLVLPSWYPSKVNLFNGDFNERTVNALSSEVKQIVLYVVKKEKGWKIDTTWLEAENVITCIVYYPALKLPIFGKYLSPLLYYVLAQYYIRKIISLYGRPALVHMYVILYAGLLGPWIKRKYKLPIVLTEHWTAFYDYAVHSLNKYPDLAKKVIRKLYRSIDHLMPVAEALARQIEPWSMGVRQTVIYNVVDTRLFNLRATQEEEVRRSGISGKLRFLHVSSMIYQKNPEGMLRAFESVLKKGIFAELWLIGPVGKNLKSTIDNSVVLKESVVIKGEVPYQDVAFYMQQSHCLLMFSRFENLPCVILEALCCGLPVIATDVGGVNEIVNSSNGILVNSEDEKELEQAITSMTANYNLYRRENISGHAIETYNYFSIANQIRKVYREVL